MKNSPYLLVFALLLVALGVWKWQSTSKERSKEREAEAQVSSALPSVFKTGFPDYVPLKERRAALSSAESALSQHAVSERRLLQQRSIDQAKQLNALTDTLLGAMTPEIPATASQPGTVTSEAPRPVVRFSDAIGLQAPPQRSASLLKHCFTSEPSRFTALWPGIPQVFHSPVSGDDDAEEAAPFLYIYWYQHEPTGDIYSITAATGKGLRKFSSQLFELEKQAVIEDAKARWVKETIDDHPEKGEATRASVYTMDGNTLRTTFRWEFVTDTHFCVLEYSLDGPGDQPLPEVGEAFRNGFEMHSGEGKTVP